VNVVADTLSHKAHYNYLPIVNISGEGSSVRITPIMAQYTVALTPMLRGEIIAAQSIDAGVAHIKRRLTEDDPKVNYFHVDEEGTLYFKDHLVVPMNHELRKKIFDEAHTSKLSIHLGSTKMYHDLKTQFWWTHLKCETTCYMAECDMCRRVKADHMTPAGLLQPLSILACKWEDISMDFIVGLPLTGHKFNSIWVIIDQLTKSAHFFPAHTFYRAERYTELYISRIMCLHGVPKTIISDWGPQFIARFWEQLNDSLGTHLIHNSAYHPQTDGQTKRVNQILEDMLRDYVLNYPDKWDKCLPLAEFSYNNSYQESLRMAPFEALYGHRCRTPVNCIKPVERMIFGHDLITEAEDIVHRIQSNLKVVMAWQESYANKWRRSLEFKAGDRVYLCVSPTWGVKRFGIKGKLAPHYIGPFLILARLRNVAYCLELPPALVGVHNVFHVSQLKKCLKPPVDVIVDDVPSLDADLSYPEHPVKILDQQDWVMRHRMIRFSKVQWSRHSEQEATWDTEEFLHSKYPEFLPPQWCTCNLFCITPLF
jgi:hypothetical protein